MTLQWTVISSFLYIEIGLTLLLIIPILKPSWWKRLFSWKIFSSIKPIWSTFFYSLLVILILLFLDSIRQQMKYGQPDERLLKETLDSKLDRQLRECKGQRNYFITGFALFLIVVIRRLITSICQCATLEASHQALTIQANNASAQLAQRLGSGTDTADGDKTVKKEEYEKMLKKLNAREVEFEAMKKQAESTNREYDRLSSEFQELQNKKGASDEEKKDV